MRNLHKETELAILAWIRSQKKRQMRRKCAEGVA